ncbi:predicted protein [Postia placenta Mad-698-R]|uniref:Uncharacterized protein n=1 Tax=Postia placenta MAD-698-R-SB12 TaxID=670580 RepID=A0A1X6MKZ6_9APHY|nr:hypothetical protein POSPLADRAFT_1159171 [Postia placenta MAD-698-R-SB12]EED83605.1 predicted protein [Postia placenta Mad-698-R]OSX56723.1 hypothetical protein POSPLADRAFT_1159171 [Postia placenta MAD-698-R-SB12]
MKIMIDCQQRCMHLRSMVAITVALILLHQYSAFRLLSVRVTACWWGRYPRGVQMRLSTQHVDGIPTTGMLHKLRSVDSGRACSLGISLSGRCVRHPMARSRLKVAWVNLISKRLGIYPTAVALVLRECLRRLTGRIRRRRGETAVALVLQACSQETMLWTPYTERSGCAPYGPSCHRVYDLQYNTIRTSPCTPTLKACKDGADGDAQRTAWANVGSASDVTLLRRAGCARQYDALAGATP